MPTGPHLVKKFTAFYGISKLITAFRRPVLILSQINPVRVTLPIHTS